MTELLIPLALQTNQRTEGSADKQAAEKMIGTGKIHHRDSAKRIVAIVGFKHSTGPDSRIARIFPGPEQKKEPYHNHEQREELPHRPTGDQWSIRLTE